jgi:Ca2+-binding RTX toxin-like protein
VGRKGADKLSGGDGNDVLVGESYGTTGYDEASAKIVRLYQATLDRLPDEAGHAGWTNALLSGVPLEQIVSGFVGSNEFQTKYGALPNADFVDLLYNTVLDRPADPGGAAGWINALNTGALSREGVVLGFSESQEFKDKMFPRTLEFSRAENEASWADDVFRVYQATLDRAPDLEGFKGWIAALANGVEYSTIIQGIVNSSEFDAKYGTLPNSDFVELLYNNVLDRPSDPGGAAGWINALNTGALSRAQVVEGFAQSDEFKDKTAQPLEDWMEGFGTDDVLDGGAGSDVLFGGLLADEFHFKFSDGGQDQIVGFEAWDTIQLEGFGFANREAAASAFVQDGSDALYQYGNGEIRLVDFNIADLTSDEFQIV